MTAGGKSQLARPCSVNSSWYLSWDVCSRFIRSLKVFNSIYIQPDVTVVCCKYLLLREGRQKLSCFDIAIVLWKYYQRKWSCSKDRNQLARDKVNVNTSIFVRVVRCCYRKMPTTSCVALLYRNHLNTNRRPPNPYTVYHSQWLKLNIMTSIVAYLSLVYIVTSSRSSDRYSIISINRQSHFDTTGIRIHIVCGVSVACLWHVRQSARPVWMSTSPSVITDQSQKHPAVVT